MSDNTEYEAIGFMNSSGHLHSHEPGPAALIPGSDAVTESWKMHHTHCYEVFRRTPNNNVETPERN